MSAYADLIERLQRRVLPGTLGAYSDKACVEAADAISRLEREKAELVEALRPFVEGAAHTQVFLRSREKMHPVGQELYAEDVERARQTLSRTQEQTA